MAAESFRLDFRLCHPDGKSMSASMSAVAPIDAWNRGPYMPGHELTVCEHLCVSAPPPSSGGTAARSRVSSRAAGSAAAVISSFQDPDSSADNLPAVSGLMLFLKAQGSKAFSGKVVTGFPQENATEQRWWV
jgi:hypothetical protein